MLTIILILLVIGLFTVLSPNIDKVNNTYYLWYNNGKNKRTFIILWKD